MEILIQQELALQQPAARSDPTAVSRLLHPEFTEIGKSGTTFDRDSIIRAMQSESHSNVKIHSQDYSCIQLEQNTCLVRYQTAIVEADGNVHSYAKRSSVWVKSENDWQLLFHQGTPCCEFNLKGSAAKLG